MNQGNKVQKIVIAAFCIVALLYFIGYAVRTFRSDVTTTVIHAATVEDSVSGTGLVAREEQVIQAAGELVQVLPGEGETVARGETIARVYKSEEALHKQELLDQKESELSSLQYVLSHSSESSDMVELGRDIVTSIENIHTRVAREDLSRLDEDLRGLEAMIYRQDYTYSGSESVTREINSLNKELDQMRKDSEKAVSKLQARWSGTFSTVVDGYEGVLTPNSISSPTPARLENLRKQRKKVNHEDYLGKIITGKRWYFAATLSEENVKRMKRNQEVTVRFDDVAGNQVMTVYSIGGTEKGKTAVVFTSNRHLNETSLLRSQAVTVVYSSYSGFRIPKEALRTERKKYYIYRVNGAQLHKIPVTILAETKDYFVVDQVIPRDKKGNVKDQSPMDQAKQIRDGDSVVIRGSNLYDGKVIGQ